MRRSEFLKLTELSVDNLKNLKRRNALPFDNADDSESDGNTGGYFERDAFSTLLTLELSKTGTDQNEAASNVALGLSGMLKRFGRDLAEKKDYIWFGLVKAEQPQADGSVAIFTFPAAGPIHDLVYFRDGPRAIEHRLAETQHVMTHISLVHAAKLLHSMKERARLNGIEIDLGWLSR